MTNNSNWRPVALSLSTLGALARLIPHPPNFAPVGAVSLYSGARLPVWQAYLVPLAVMLVTDPILSIFVYHVPAFSRIQLFIYASFLIGVLLGRFLRGTENIAKIGAFTLLNSVQFFLISNFGSWYLFHSYPMTVAGLVDCYVAAIPFFGWTLASDVLYVAVLFGVHALLTRTIAANERVAVAA